MFSMKGFHPSLRPEERYCFDYFEGGGCEALAVDPAVAVAVAGCGFADVAVELNQTRSR